MTFHELSKLMNGFIEKHIDQTRSTSEGSPPLSSFRIYITTNESRKLSDCDLFTFEPHILKQPHGNYGIRKEDIYYFEGKRLKIL